MADNVTLRKENPLLPSEDYVALRKQGLQEIEKLASNIWTEYNSSDPGVTILEAVCYAITDLGYRTGFEMRDLLAPSDLNEDTWKQIFYTARRILHNSPLTISDYRKLIVDVKGVRNAWIQPSKDYEVPIWIDYNYFQLSDDHDCGCEDHEQKKCFGRLGTIPVSKAEADKYLTEHKKRIKDLTGVDLSYLPAKIVEFEGLYNVMIEYEEDVLEDGRREEVREQVYDRLMRNRNLCEDVLSVNAVDHEEFGVRACLMLEDYADPDEVVAEMFFIIHKYLSPSIKFYTFRQMSEEKKLQVDEIFDGPPLRHGFIDTDELEDTDLYRDVHLSDLINLIADIKGVKAIASLHVPMASTATTKAEAQQYFNEWIHDLLDQQKIGKVQPSRSEVVCCKERDIISYYTGKKNDRRPERMLKLFSDKKALERKFKLEGIELDLAVPTGENMDLEDYFPVTESLPLCYGVSERAGLPVDADEKRKVQALQLKGFMLFFEQLLSDYLVQLNSLRSLFSFDDSVRRTYFTRTLTEINSLSNLLVDHQNRGGDFEQVLDDFSHVLQNLVETTKKFHVRRNKFLDHMLARFSESLEEYETMMRWLVPNKVDERLIADKIRILKDGEYYKISTNRSKGYDYSSGETLETSNISGAERRISRLLGFGEVERRSLVPGFVTIVPVSEHVSNYQKRNSNGELINVVVLYDPDNEGEVLLTSEEAIAGCCTELLMNEIITHAGDRKSYLVRNESKAGSKRKGEKDKYAFELYDGADPQTATLLAKSEVVNSREELEKLFKKIRNVVNRIDRNEGLHLVEHLLLRPRVDTMFDKAGGRMDAHLLSICLDACDLGKGLDEGTDVPPYRKIVTRVPAEKCYDKMPWVLQYERKDELGTFGKSILFQQTFIDPTKKVPLKFRKYEAMAQRIAELHEYGSERANYVIESNGREAPALLKYRFIILDENGKPLAQSLFAFNKKTQLQTETDDDIELEIAMLIRYFGYQLDLYCKENPCDNNEDPYSFRATAVLPCWPLRFRDPGFRRLVEKTIQTESPAHVHIKVVWVGIPEMKRFEDAYFAWMDEMCDTRIPDYTHADPLVEVINTLRPCGACSDDCHHDSKPDGK